MRRSVLITVPAIILHTTVATNSRLAPVILSSSMLTSWKVSVPPRSGRPAPIMAMENLITSSRRLSERLQPCHWCPSLNCSSPGARNVPTYISDYGCSDTEQRPMRMALISLSLDILSPLSATRLVADAVKPRLATPAR